MPADHDKAGRKPAENRVRASKSFPVFRVPMSSAGARALQEGVEIADAAIGKYKQVPVAMGEESITANVSIVWQIQ